MAAVPSDNMVFRSLLQTKLLCEQGAELAADMLQMAANPAEGTAVTYCPPKDQGTSLIFSTLVTAQVLGCSSPGRGHAQIFTQEASQTSNVEKQWCSSS